MRTVKLYIVGSVASGKSTLAEQLSGKTGVPCYHLDEFVHKKDPTGEFGNVRRDPEERDALFQAALAGDCILEDTGREIFLEGMRQADRILVLDLPYRVRAHRILKRHVRQVLGVERANYKPSLEMVRLMFKWARNFDTGADGVKARIAPFADKSVVLRSRKEIKQFLSGFPENMDS